MKTIGKDEILDRLNDDSLEIIEVLSPEKYEKGHIQGALNIPLKKIVSESQKRFKKDQEMVIYCSGKECKTSNRAVEKLEEMGFENVYHYKGGKEEWSEADLPMESK